MCGLVVWARCTSLSGQVGQPPHAIRGGPV